MGLVTLWHVGSSQIRDQTLVLAIGRQILNHWITRKAPLFSFKALGRWNWRRLKQHIFIVGSLACGQMDCKIYLSVGGQSEALRPWQR